MLFFFAALLQVQLPQPPSFLGSPAENQFQSIRSDDPANIEVLQKHANFAVSLATFGAPRSAGSEVQAFVAKRENAAKSALLLQELVRREPTQAPFAAAMFASLSTELFTSPYADMHAIQEVCFAVVELAALPMGTVFASCQTQLSGQSSCHVNVHRVSVSFQLLRHSTLPDSKGCGSKSCKV